MVDVDELKQKELENIKNQDNTVDEEVYDLESLILDGIDKRVPIKIVYPSTDGQPPKSTTAQIRPVTSVEWNNAMNIGFDKNNKDTNADIEILKVALYNKEGEPFDKTAIKYMPTGVASEISRKIGEISGIRVSQEDQMMVVSKMMGF